MLFRSVMHPQVEVQGRAESSSLQVLVSEMEVQRSKLEGQSGDGLLSELEFAFDRAHRHDSC